MKSQLKINLNFFINLYYNNQKDINHNNKSQILLHQKLYMSENQQPNPPNLNPQENQPSNQDNHQNENQNQHNINQLQTQPQPQPSMDLENQSYQPQNQQPSANIEEQVNDNIQGQVNDNNQDPEEGEEGQIEQQNPSERHQEVKNVDEQNIASQTSVDKDSYINKLQTYLSRIKADLETKSKAFQELSQDNKKTKEALKKLRFDFLSSKQQISTLTQHQSQLQKQNDHIKKLNQQLNDQIKTYREAGDINFYKNQITQLQKLLEIQKQQLQMKSSMIDEKDQLNSTLTNTSQTKIEILTLIQKYQNQNRQLAKRHAEVTLTNTELQNNTKKLQSDLHQLKITNAEVQASLALEKQKVMQLEEQFSKKEEQFQRKLKLSEESLAKKINNQSRSQIAQGNIVVVQQKVAKSPSEQYGIKILTPIQERNLIMREFIQLQIKYQSVMEELSNLRQRHFNTLKQIKNSSASQISKKDYSELYKKYTKLRKCLENSLINEENIRKELLRYATLNNASVLSEENKIINFSQGQEARNAFSRYKSLLLEQPENPIDKVQKIIEKSFDSQKQLFTLKQQLETKQKLIKAEKFLKQKEEKIQHLQKQTQKVKNLIQLYDSQLTYRNDQIELLRKNNQQNISRIYELEKNCISKEKQQILYSQIEEKRILNEILQIKNIQALKENNLIKNQKQILTQLYTNLKSIYEEILNREPQLQVSQNKPQEQRQQNIMQIQAQPCKQCKERQERQKQIKFAEIQSQTQGITELYFKQIKELLTILRKFPKKVDTVTGLLEAQKSTIHEVKNKYDRAIETYQANSKQLEEEKKANDQWRVKQKEQIREEFQQIRQLLMNERLVTALRKAKSLIEFYEQNAPEAEGEQNLQEGEEQEGIEKNEANEKNEVNQKNEGNVQEPIEQEKQNP